MSEHEQPGAEHPLFRAVQILADWCHPATYGDEAEAAFAVAEREVRALIEREKDYRENSELFLRERDRLAARVAERDRLKARVAELEAAVRWALGEKGSFARQGPNDSPYWWRTELRRRALLDARKEDASG
jgi:hypothetical protein